MTGLRVLLVEDDELNQQLVQAILARSANPVLCGAQLATAGSLAQARAALAAGAIDIVLLDMGLPDGSGLDLAAELQHRSDQASPAVIALSGAAVEHREAALAAGCVAVLGKPYGAAELADLLMAHLPVGEAR
jgi:CheY-like chemotaxis protein